MRPILWLFALIIISACGIDGPPRGDPGNEAPNDRSFTPEDY